MKRSTSFFTSKWKRYNNLQDPKQSVSELYKLYYRCTIYCESPRKHKTNRSVALLQEPTSNNSDKKSSPQSRRVLQEHSTNEMTCTYIQTRSSIGRTALDPTSLLDAVILMLKSVKLPRTILAH